MHRRAPLATMSKPQNKSPLARMGREGNTTLRGSTHVQRAVRPPIHAERPRYAALDVADNEANRARLLDFGGGLTGGAYCAAPRATLSRRAPISVVKPQWRVLLAAIYLTIPPKPQIVKQPTSPGAVGARDRPGAATRIGAGHLPPKGLARGSAARDLLIAMYYGPARVKPLQAARLCRSAITTVRNFL